MQIEIVKKQDKSGLNINDYEILLDGKKVDRLMELNINISSESINIATLTVAVDKIKVDAEFAAILNANKNYNFCNKKNPKVAKNKIKRVAQKVQLFLSKNKNQTRR